MVEVVAEDERVARDRGVWEEREGDGVLVVSVWGVREVGRCGGRVVGET